MEQIEIFYGKYINQINNKIPKADILIDQVGQISRRVEPGEPNIPTSESFSFALANLDPNGNQRYPFTFWEDQARSQGEGAIQPLQIYFRVNVAGGSQFRGMMKSLTYSKDMGMCEIELADALEILRNSEKPMLRSFEFTAKLISTDFPGLGRNDLDAAKSIDDIDIDHAALTFRIQLEFNEGQPLSTEFAKHLGWDNTEYTSQRSITRSAWVQIEEITLLTRVTFIQRTNVGETFQDLWAVVWHNAEDPIENTADGETTVTPPRGQYLNHDGNRLEGSAPTFGEMEEFKMVIHEPDLGNGTFAALHIDDTNLTEDFIFGVPFTEEASHIQITSAAYSFFDVVELVTAASKRELDSFHSTDSVSFLTFFDTTKVTDLHRNAFWADVKMTGLASHTLADAVTAIARQTSSWVYTDRFGNIVLHSRNYAQGLLSDPGNTALVENEDWEPLDGVRYDNGFATYEAEIPVDLIEINNVKTQGTLTIFANPAGIVNNASLRNKKVKLSNFRIHNLGVPSEADIEGIPVIRYSPDDASWPHIEGLDEFLPTPDQQLQLIAQSFPWPTGLSRIKLPVSFSNLVIDDGFSVLIKGLDYIIDELDQLWWVREELVNPQELTVECLVQIIGVLEDESS